MRLLDPAQEEAFWARVEKEAPTLWIRTETYRLCELLRMHVQLALETGTETERIQTLLKNVRRAVLDARSEP